MISKKFAPLAYDFDEEIVEVFVVGRLVMATNSVGELVVIGGEDFTESGEVWGKEEG